MPIMNLRATYSMSRDDFNKECLELFLIKTAVYASFLNDVYTYTVTSQSGLRLSV